MSTDYLIRQNPTWSKVTHCPYYTPMRLSRCLHHQRPVPVRGTGIPDRSLCCGPGAKINVSPAARKRRGVRPLNAPALQPLAAYFWNRRFPRELYHHWGVHRKADKQNELQLWNGIPSFRDDQCLILHKPFAFDDNCVSVLCFWRASRFVSFCDI